MNPAVKSVTPCEDYVLSLTFENGEQGILDMKPYLTFGVFKRLQPLKHFKQVRVTFDTIEWATVGVDLDPDFVYQKSQRTT